VLLLLHQRLLDAAAAACLEQWNAASGGASKLGHRGKLVVP
jgi:hypothetical protein